ncbi:MAG: glycolate oxidase subunit GlcF [Proteobacteria bacterium]|nr:glycolate oxidase subunit GlcF [Pseudomonadota bacterium]
MRAKFSSEILASADNAEMASIMRACVHCGFCNATCPTYQLRGDELDGPRGRIYLIKSMLEEADLSRSTQLHLDRCLTCRACETTCPSGVNYSRLVELARPIVDAKVGRRPLERFKRWLLRQIVPHPKRFAALVFVARIFRPLYPRALAELVPKAKRKQLPSQAGLHERKMLIIDGCVQQVAAPEINAAAREVFSRLKIELVSSTYAGCCGAVSYHLGEVAEAQGYARRNIDAWSPAVAAGAQALISTSTGCSVMLKEYGGLLRDDPIYADRARQISALVRDPSEVLDLGELAKAYQVKSDRRIAFHAPCTMQHGLRVAQRAEACLNAVGFELTEVPDGHLCCGSAGTYSLLQPALSEQLLDQKLAALEGASPTTIASANIGCLMHLQRRAKTEVRHWLEMIRPHAVKPDHQP